MSRFASSPYKNVLANQSKKENWWSEVQVATASPSESGDLIKCGVEHWFAQSTVSGHLLVLPYEGANGKFNHQAPMLRVTASPISTFEVSRFGDLLAAGTMDGKICVHNIPRVDSFTSAAILSPTPLVTFSSPTSQPISNLSFHPTTPQILLSTQGSTLRVYDASSGSNEIYDIKGASDIWSAGWSLDGRIVSTASKDGILRLYDIRTNSPSAILETPSHSGLKPSRHVHLCNGRILTTGFSKSRDREYSLFDTRNFEKAIKTNRVDSGIMAPLVPVADVERNIVYLAGKGDMTLRWVEVGGNAVFTEGASSLPFPIQSFALAPPPVLNLMRAEINRVLVTSTNSNVIPISIEGPRRQYVDFHRDLFPLVRSLVGCQSAAEWREGADGQVEMVQLEPGVAMKRGLKEQGLGVIHKTVDTAVKPESERIPESIAPEVAPFSPTSTPAPASASTSSSIEAPPASSKQTTEMLAPVLLEPASPDIPSVANTSAPSPSNPPRSVAQPSTPAPLIPFEVQSTAPPTTIAPIPTSSARGAPFNPRWSRKFLVGKTPLKPDYSGLHSLSATMSAGCEMLKTNHLFFFFPLSGAGGRMGVHPLSAIGRFPTAIPSLLNGAGIVDFELDPFDPHRVFIAGDDSRIKVYRIPDGGLEQDLGEAEVSLGDNKMDRISEIKCHPTAKDLLLSISEDHGSPTVRVWDVISRSVVAEVVLPTGPISSAAWSPDGCLLALATKVKTLLILDPRSPTPVLSATSHDSMRPVRVTWISDTSLITTGFSKTAMREINLYTLSESKTQVNKISSQSLDVSPAPLFPYADLDTNVLTLYARGERSCHAFEIHPEDTKQPFTRLPSFEHGTLQSGISFLPKQRNNIKGIEVLRALRLTPQTVEVVSFTVPRAKVEFFQDDIFVPTRDLETPTVSIVNWVKGENVPPHMIGLRPDGAKLLSEAPATVTKGSTRSLITGPVLTDSQIQEAYMAKLFAAAKADGDEEEVIRSKNAPVDDDW